MGLQIQIQNFFDPIVRHCKILAKLFVVVRVNNQNRNQKQLVASNNGVKLGEIFSELSFLCSMPMSFHI